MGEDRMLGHGRYDLDGDAELGYHRDGGRHRDVVQRERAVSPDDVGRVKVVLSANREYMDEINEYPMPSSQRNVESRSHGYSGRDLSPLGREVRDSGYDRARDDRERNYGSFRVIGHGR